MKKILILGGAKAQVQLIQAAKELGYYVVLCDFTTTNPGIALVDKHYQVSTLDREAVLEVAIKEHIDGVISNSEPAMLNVAYISQYLGLVGNNVESVEKLLSKNKFRKLQKDAGVYAPAHSIVSSFEELLEAVKSMKLPIIVKPTESSGTRGTKKIDVFDEMKLCEAFMTCCEFSRNNLVSVEEYVEMKCLRVNDADIFVLGDEIIWDGWLWEDRSPDTPMLPMTEIFPMALSDEEKTKISSTVERIIHKSGVRHGEYNVETYFTDNGEVFVIEINPRQAGNYIPKLIKQHTGVDLSKLLVSTAVNDMRYYEYLKTYKRQKNFVTLQVVFSKSEGAFEKLFISPELEKYVQWIELKAKPGDYVKQGINATDAIAFVDIQFDDYETQHKFTDDIEKYIYPIVKENFLLRHGISIGVADRSFESKRLLSFMKDVDNLYIVPLSKQAEKVGMTLESYAVKLSAKGTIVYAELSNGELIGVIIGYTHDTPDDTSYITQVVVKSEYQKLGVFKKMFEEYENYAKKQNMKSLWLTTEKVNYAALNAYQKVCLKIDDDTFLKNDLLRLNKTLK